LGIWGAISLGTLGAYLRYRVLVKKDENKEVAHPSFAIFMDALAPGIVLAQAIGRWGNWFNIELFGKPTSLPWGLEVPPNKRPEGYESFSSFHPTFLYESLWCLAIALLLVWASRDLTTPKFRSGGIFLLYVAGYCLGRFWIEGLRIDESEIILGLRFNIWVSVVIFTLAALAVFRRRVQKPR
jgi:prolipoprotein diacylglyceryl transferase